MARATPALPCTRGHSVRSSASARAAWTDLQQRQRAPARGGLGDGRGLAAAGDLALPGEAHGQAEGAARHQPVEGPRLLRRLHHPGHVGLRPPGADRGPRRPEGGRRPGGGGCEFGARGVFEIGQCRLGPVQRPGGEAGDVARHGAAAGLPRGGGRDLEGLLVAALLQQRLRDLRPQQGGIGAGGAAALDHR
jgi:hypothetical protein